MPHVVVQRLNQAIFLKQGNEYAGADHAQFGVLPAHQAFGAAQHGRVVLNVVFGLEIHLELSFRNRSANIFYQPDVVELRLVQRVVVHADVARVAGAHGVGRHFGPIKTALNVDLLIRFRIDAHPQSDAVRSALVALRQRSGGTVEQLLPVVPMRTIDQEGVGLFAADNALGFMGDFLQLDAELPENLVGIALAVALVDHVEVVDVDHNRVHIAILVPLIILLGIAIEELLVEKARELIPLRGANDVAILRKLNDPQNPRQHHIHRRIGLRDKIDRAQLQALQLGRLFGGGDNDRNMLQIVIRLRDLQQLQPRHNRHQQVQYHQGERFTVLAHDVQRFPTVFGFEHLIVLLQIAAENLPVDHLIIDNQNDSSVADGAQIFV